jgi:hypothetical protein
MKKKEEPLNNTVLRSSVNKASDLLVGKDLPETPHPLEIHLSRTGTKRRAFWLGFQSAMIYMEKEDKKCRKIAEELFKDLPDPHLPNYKKPYVLSESEKRRMRKPVRFKMDVGCADY